jgi:hypothetical protein
MMHVKVYCNIYVAQILTQLSANSRHQNSTNDLILCIDLSDRT